MFRKISESERNFLIVHIIFAIVCIPAFMDWKIMEHPNRVNLFNDFTWALCVTTIFILVMFCFFMFSLKAVSESKSKQMSYLIMLLTIALYPMYFCDSYFGTRDVYGYIVLYVLIMCITLDKCLWIVPMGMAIAMFVNPTGILIAGVIIPLLLIDKWLMSNREKRYADILILTVAAEIVSVILAIHFKMFALDVQGRISGKRFLLLLVLLIPIWIIWILLYGRFFKRADGIKKWYNAIVAISGIPAFLLWALVSDYTRSLMSIFIHYTTIAISMIIIGDREFVDSTDETFDDINKYIQIGVVVLIYIFMILTFKVFGEVLVDTEKLLKLKV